MELKWCSLLFKVDYIHAMAVDQLTGIRLFFYFESTNLCILGGCTKPINSNVHCKKWP